MCRPGGLFSAENRKGLIVLAAATWLSMLVYAPLTVFAILFAALEDEFHASATAIGEIGSVAWAVLNISTPLPTYLIQKWGPRFATVTGVLMLGGGLFLCTFSKQIWMLVLFYGVVQGLGLCFIQAVTTHLLTSFFRGSALVRALSLAAIGETVGMFVLSPIFTLGVTKLGWRLICQIAAVVIITLCLPTCFVLDGSSTHAHFSTEADETQKDCVKKEEKESADGLLRKGEIGAVKRKLLAQTMRIPGIWLFSMATVLYVLCMGFVMISLVEVLVVQGQSMTDSAWFVTIFAISQMVMKIVNIIIGNRLFINNMKHLVLMCITGGLMSLGMVYFENVVAYTFAYSIVNGLLRGNIASRNLCAAIEVFGHDIIPILINFLYISVGIAFLSASLVGGLSYDLTGSYRFAHIAIVVFWFLAALLLMPLALGWPSFVFTPLYCCHRDYTKVQSAPDEHINSGTGIAPCGTNSQGNGKYPCSTHAEHECDPHIGADSDVIERTLQVKDEQGQLTLISNLRETTC